MAKKPEGISLADLLIGQKNSNLKMNATIEAQLRSHLEVEKIAKQDRLLQVVQTVDSVKSVDDEDKIVTELNDGLVKKSGDGLNANVIKMSKSIEKQVHILTKISEDTAEGVANMAAEGKYTNKIQDKFASIGKFFEGLKGGGLGTSILKSMNVLGIFNKKIEERNFIKQQKAIGSTDNTKILKEKFEARTKVSKDINANEEKIEKLKKLTGLNENKLKNTEHGKELFETRKSLAGEYSKHDLRANLLNTNDKEDNSLAKKEDLTEADVKNNENQTEQIDLLSKIEKNTEPGNLKPPTAKEDNKGGLFSGIGGKMKGIATGLGDAAKGLLALAGSVWIISKAFQNFATVKFSDFMMGIGAITALVVASRFIKDSDAGKTLLALGAALLITSLALSNFADIKWESILKAGLVLGGLALATKAMDDVSAAGTLLAIGAALWITSKAFANFGKLDWETIGKGLVVLTAITAAVIGIGLLGPVVLAGAAALLALGAALWVASKAFANIAESLDTFAAGMERIAAISGTDLMGTAAGIAAISAAMAAFGVSSVVSGLGNLVSGLLSIGQDSPIDKLEKISKMGDGLQKAADALERIGKAMQTIAGSGAGIEVGKDSIKTAGAKKAPMTKIAGPGSENSSLTETSEGTLSGVTTDQIKAHPNFNKYYKEAKSFPGTTDSDAYNDAAMQVKDDMIKSKGITANQVQPTATQKANNVYGASSKNAEAASKPTQVAGPAIVNAPTTVNSSNQNAIIKTPIRNQDNTLISYLKSRYSQ